jgi:hypothetical protein
MKMLSRTKPLRSCASLWALSSKPRCSISQASLHAAAVTAQVDTALQKLGLDPWSGFGVGIEKVCEPVEAATDCNPLHMHTAPAGTAGEHKVIVFGQSVCRSFVSCCHAFLSWPGCRHNC